jgi:DNA repair protein RadD
MAFDLGTAARIGHNGGPPLVARWYQEEAVDSLFDYFNRKGGRDENGRPIKANPVIALPTGTGKSLVIALFIQRALAMFPTTRVLMMTHVKELIKQNAAKLIEAWPLAPLGIYSSGLNQRDFVQPIIFGGVQSAVKNLEAFGHRDLLVIDEAHLVGNEGNYIKLVEYLTNVNPFLKIILLSATPYRQGMGLLTNGLIATDIVYDLCNIDGFSRLMAEGYLCPLISRPTDVEIDVSGVHVNNGEYNQGEVEAAADKVTFDACKEFVAYGHNRRSWLVFAAGVKHADHIGELLNGAFGVNAVVIHSKKPDKDNEDNLASWKRGEVQCAVSMNALTTGVDNPYCDYIGDMQPTLSTGKHVQKYGRGTRPVYAPGFDLTDFNSRWQAIYAGGKQNTLVMDFARNTRRLGPINDPLIPRMKGQGSPGDAPIKICPKPKGGCGNYNHTRAPSCIVCGYEWPYEVNISKHAGTEEILRSDMPQIEPFDVSHQVLTAHTSRSSGRSSIKVSYFCKRGAAMLTFYEYISIEAAGFWGKRGRDWFRQRYGEPTEGMTNADVLRLASLMRTPARINVWVNKETPEVKGYEF